MEDASRHPKDLSNEEQPTQGEMPAASTDMEDRTLLEEAPIGGTDTFHTWNKGNIHRNPRQTSEGEKARRP